MTSNARPARRSSLFLLELTVAILFFCLCSALCVRLFVQARSAGKDSENLTMSVRQLSSMAELFRGSSDFEEALLEAYPQAEASGDGYSADGDRYTVYFDQNWQTCQAGEEGYTVELVLSVKDGMASCDLTAREAQSGASGDEAVIYTLHTEKFTGEVENRE